MIAVESYNYDFYSITNFLKKDIENQPGSVNLNLSKISEKLSVLVRFAFYKALHVLYLHCIFYERNNIVNIQLMNSVVEKFRFGGFTSYLLEKD